MVGRPKTGTISATGTVRLGQASDGKVSSWLIQFEDNSFSGAGVTIKGRAADGEDSRPDVALAYTDRADGAIKTAAIASDAMIFVDSAGVSVLLDATVTSGSLGYSAVPVVG